MRRIISVTIRIPKQMKNSLPIFAKYERAKYWTEKKEAYAKETETFMATIAPPSTGRRLTGPDDTSHLTDEDFRQPNDDDDLPF